MLHNIILSVFHFYETKILYVVKVRLRSRLNSKYTQGLNCMYSLTNRTTRFRSLTFPYFLSIVDGGYGNWSLNSTCNATCGQRFETWFRACNNPEPKYGGRNCSHLGKQFALKQCSAKPCPGKLNAQISSCCKGKVWSFIFSLFCYDL